MKRRRTDKSRFRDKHAGLPAAEIEALWRLWKLKEAAFHDLAYEFQQFDEFARERYDAGDTPLLTRRALELDVRFGKILNRIVSPNRSG